MTKGVSQGAGHPEASAGVCPAHQTADPLLPTADFLTEVLER